MPDVAWLDASSAMTTAATEIRIGEPVILSPDTNYQDATFAIGNAVKSL